MSRRLGKENQTNRWLVIPAAILESCYKLAWRVNESYECAGRHLIKEKKKKKNL